MTASVAVAVPTAERAATPRSGLVGITEIDPSGAERDYLDLGPIPPEFAPAGEGLEFPPIAEAGDGS